MGSAPKCAHAHTCREAGVVRVSHPDDSPAGTPHVYLISIAEKGGFHINYVKCVYICCLLQFYS